MATPVLTVLAAGAGHTPPRGAAARLHNVTRPPPSTLPTVPREWTSSLDWPRPGGPPMLEKTMPPPGPETYVFCCGPPPMIKSAIAKLEALGHDPSHVLCF